MNLTQKVLLLATVPLILVISAITFVVTYQAQSLSEREIASFERSMLAAKKSELLNYLRLAQTSIDHIYGSAAVDDELAKSRVKEVLNALTYGADGYFFVYDYDGNNLVHPRQPHRVGNNWLNLKDPKGNLVIANLIKRAKEGGGYHRYYWEKPSTKEVVDKISYAIALEKWNWMLGTGLYIDDVAQQVKTVEQEVSQRIKETSLIILGITLFSLFTVFVAGLAINLHERRLADVKQKVLTQRIIETQEEERGRVARELHDGISQILVSVKYALELALNKVRKNEDDAGHSIEKGWQGLHMAIAEVRRISRDLRPSALDDLGLSPALESLANEFSKRTGIKVEINTVAFRNMLPDDAKTTLFRVAQETLTNIERHANADQVNIELSAPDGAVTLSISDNGRGFDPNAFDARKSPLKGIGLRNMQERLEYHNGKLNIFSTNTQTRIEARLPKGVLLTTGQEK